jgi:uncharacterized protein YfiM (DUF2279 family)
MIIFITPLRSEANENNLLVLAEKLNSSKQDRWFAEDKARHLIGSFMSTILFAQVSEQIHDSPASKNKIFGVSICLTLGVTKEVTDHYKKNNQFSWKDMTANMVGIVCAIFLLGFD